MWFTDAIEQALARIPVDVSGVVVAVSGGADSVALLRAMIHIRERNTSLIVAHLNHQLRGEASDADEHFVRSLVERMIESGESNLHCAHSRCDLGAAGENLEAEGRRLRYDFLGRTAREFGANLIVTGHTANDQAETVLHRLLRGTGLQGLRGIAAARELEPGLMLARPMLGVSRAQVLEFLEEVGQPFRDDESNSDRRFTRNRIRHDLVPLLETDYNPAVVTLLARLADQAQELFADVEREARELLQSCELPRAGTMFVINADRFGRASRNLRREAIRQLWLRERWPRDRLGHVEWDRIIEVADGVRTAMDLPGRIHVRRQGHVVQIGPRL